MTSVLPQPRLGILNLPYLRLFRAKFFAENAPFYVDRDRYFGPSTARQLSMRDRYARIPQNVLWSKVTADTVQKSTVKVQRERIKRRVREALWEELKAKGYDILGRREQNSLKGTLEILIFDFNCLNVPFDKLRKQAGIVVEEVERQNARRRKREQEHGFQQVRDFKRSDFDQIRAQDPYVSNHEKGARH